MTETIRFEDHPGEECGIVGIFAPSEDVASMAYFALFALQHRGQEAAGIAVCDGEIARIHKDMGLVSQVFTQENLRSLRGRYAIGHTRYSTTGSSVLRNAQPFLIETRYGPLAIAHNGNLVNTYDLRRELLQKGVGLLSSSDSEVITLMLAGAEGATWEERIRATMPKWRGAYSLVHPHPRGRLRRARPVGLPPAVGRPAATAAGTPPPRNPARCARSAARRSARSSRAR